MKADEILRDDLKRGKYPDAIPPFTVWRRLDCVLTSEFDFPKLLDDPKNIGKNLRAYNNNFSENMRDAIDRFKLRGTIDTLAPTCTRTRWTTTPWGRSSRN